ncbi:MAG: hypothetical protein DRP35_04680 [Candidatus Zixiibacteriota bacterium]|nr:MAG: hypothetical protein DRP35_04680 [candidate division Zixibacteria bacterium]
MRRYIIFFIILFLQFLSFSEIQSRNTFFTKASKTTDIPGNPAYCLAVHNVGKINLTVQNNGVLGLYSIYGQSYQDCFTGEQIDYGLEFPKGTKLENLYYSTLWVGAILDDDTVVTTGLDGWNNDGREFHPEEAPDGKMIFRSIIDPEAPEFEGAVSEQDFIAEYTDTLRGVSHDFFYSRPHRPLYLKVKQKSYAWSYPYAEDIVLVDYEITNIGASNLHDVNIGLFVDANIGFNNGYWNDDISGYLETIPVELNCGTFEDTINVGWTADNNGDPINGKFIVELGVDEPSFLILRKSAPHFIGTRILRTPEENLKKSFNWWVSNYDKKYDFGPMSLANFRDFGTGGMGTPEGDKNKYYIMSNGEIDYNQNLIGTIKDYHNSWYVPGRYTSMKIGRGANTKYVMSYGSFDLPSTVTVNFTVAFIGGEDLHKLPLNGSNIYTKPELYYSNLDFSDMGENARWAGWVYDNPGVDTDGDGYYGKFRVCATESTEVSGRWIVSDADTFFYEGDGVPDFRGAAPPPAPSVKIIPVVGGLKVRFNGHFSERSRDFLTGEIDFEGYNIYMARDERKSSYALVATHDRENYDKFVWSRYYKGGKYVLYDAPFTIEELRCLYGDSCNDMNFNPNNYGIGNLFRVADSSFYFAPHGGNTNRGGINTPIKRVYPEMEPIPLKTDLTTLDDSCFTEDGYLKYYEYEYVIENLLPTIPYYVSVTAFDVGSPKSDLDILETSIDQDAKVYYPLADTDQVEGDDLKVYIYPNPYRIDGNYRRKGYEGRNDIRPSYRVRKLHFANLPPKCTISIFSLDGDLIRELDHDEDPFSPNSRHHDWNMISRNTQEIVSGLYYWTVEDSGGQVQMGKLVVIM